MSPGPVPRESRPSTISPSPRRAASSPTGSFTVRRPPRLARILAIVPLVLYLAVERRLHLRDGPGADLAVAVLVLVLGLAGFGAAFGLARNTGWGIPAALAVAGVNVVAAIVALLTDSEGAIVGLVLSAVALALAFVASSGTRQASMA